MQAQRAQSSFSNRADYEPHYRAYQTDTRPQFSFEHTTVHSFIHILREVFLNNIMRSFEIMTSCDSMYFRAMFEASDSDDSSFNRIAPDAHSLITINKDG